MQEFVINISQNAINKLSAIIEGNKKLRLSIDGGGCRGFQYKFEIVEEQDKEDYLFEQDNVAIIIDPASQRFLHGSELDFIDNLYESGFVVQNPNAARKCGCGNSFSM